MKDGLCKKMWVHGSPKGGLTATITFLNNGIMKSTLENKSTKNSFKKREMFKGVDQLVRISNKEIFTDIKNVLEKIKTKVEDLFQNIIIKQKQKSSALGGWGVLYDYNKWSRYFFSAVHG
jgi:hypothetical protein